MADQDDDLLRPDEIEALLGGADASDTPSASSTDPSQQLDPSEIEDLLSQAQPGPQGTPADPKTEELLDQAEADLAAALSGSARPEGQPNAQQAQPYQMQSFDKTAGNSNTTLPLTFLQDVELDLRIELGRTELLIEDIVKLREGSVVPLDKLAGDPVDILVNGRLVARGEVLVLNDNFCVRVAEILSPSF